MMVNYKTDTLKKEWRLWAEQTAQEDKTGGYQAYWYDFWWSCSKSSKMKKKNTCDSKKSKKY